jgi:hypothetical protein
VQNILIGNAIMLISSILMMLAGLPKKKQTCLFLQTIQIFGMAIGNLFLGSFPGFFINCCSGTRNLLASKGKLNNFAKIAIIIISGIISCLYNDIGILVIFPLLSLATFTIFMDTNNTVLFKWLVISGNVLWFVHDIFIMSYVAVAFDILGTITNLIGIYRIKKEKSPQICKRNADIVL